MNFLLAASGISLTAVILTEVRRLKAIEEKFFLHFKLIFLYMLIFIFLPALQMFLRCDVNVFSRTQNSMKLFDRLFEYQKNMYYFLCFFKS